MAFLDIDVRPNRPNVLVTSEAKRLFALLQIRPGAERPVVEVGTNLALVLDKSGSMRESGKMTHLREAVRFVARQLRPVDLLSLVSFDHHAHVVFPAGAVLDYGAIDRAIDELYADGGTCLSEGMKVGRRELDKHRQTGRANRMILLTDGETERYDEKGCLQLARQMADTDPPISVSTIGLGDRYNETLLIAIADATKGKPHWLRNPVDTPAIFAAELTGAQSVVALNPTLTIKLTDGVTLERVTQCVPEIVEQPVAVASRLATLRLPDVGDEGLSLLFQFQLPSRHVGDYQIAVFRVDMGGDLPSVATNLVVKYTDNGGLAAQVNADVMVIVDRVSVAAIQNRGLDAIQAGQSGKATQLLRNAHTQLLEMGDDDQAKQVQQLLEELNRGGQASANTTRKLRYGTRDLSSLNNP